MKQAGATLRAEVRSGAAAVASDNRLAEKLEKERALAMLARQRAVRYDGGGGEGDEDEGAAAGAAAEAPKESLGDALTRVLAAEAANNQLGLGTTVVSVSRSFYDTCAAPPPG